MTTISLLIGLAIVLAMAIRLVGHWLNPATLHTAVWFAMVALYALGPVMFRPLSWITVAVIIGAHVAFLAGSILAHKLDRGPIPRVAAASCGLAGPWLIRLAFLLAVLGLLGSGMVWQTLLAKYGSLDQVFAAPWRVRDAFLGHMIEIPFQAKLLCACAVAVLPISAILTVEQKAAWIPSLLALAAIVIEGLATFGRASLIWATALMMIAIVHGRQRLGKRLIPPRVLLAGVLLLVVLVAGTSAIRQVRGGGDNFEFTVSPYRRYLAYPLPDGLLSNSLLANYVYFTGALPAFDWFIDNDTSDLYWGTASFEGVARDLEELGLSVPVREHYYAYAAIPFEFNVFSYLREAVMDYGLAGSLLFTFVCGLISTRIHTLARRSGRLSWMIASSGVYTTIAYSIIISLTNSELFLFGICLAVGLARMFEKPAEQRQESGLIAQAKADRPHEIARVLP